MAVPFTFPSHRQLCPFKRCAYESFLNVLGCSNIVDSTIGNLAVMSNDLEASQWLRNQESAEARKLPRPVRCELAHQTTLCCLSSFLYLWVLQVCLFRPHYRTSRHTLFLGPPSCSCLQITLTLSGFKFTLSCYKNRRYIHQCIVQLLTGYCVFTVFANTFCQNSGMVKKVVYMLHQLCFLRTHPGECLYLL